jgi:hypothetical protein
MTPTSIRWLLTTYTVCLIGAGMNHAYDIWQGGWLPYRAAPAPINLDWTSLALFDPLAAVLLWWRMKAGLVLTAAIIISDVAVNSYGRYVLGYSGWYSDVSIQLQTLFLGFVLGSLPFAWSRTNER